MLKDSMQRRIFDEFNKKKNIIKLIEIMFVQFIKINFSSPRKDSRDQGYN